MKKKIRFTIPAAAALVLALSLALTACRSASSKASAAAEYKEAAYDGGSGYTMNYAAEDAVASEEMAYEPDYAPETAASASASGVSEKAYNGEVKLIYRADVSAETKEIDKATAELEALAASMGGYVEYSDIGNYGYGNDNNRYANYTIRIPSEKYEAFLAALNTSGSCNVRSISKSTEDVGAEYADTEARLKTLRIKQERLQELLSQAENMEDIISIENALTDVEYQIEWNSSTLNRYDALVNYSTVTVNLQQVARETQTTEGTSLSERIANSFHNGIAAFATGFENFMVFLAGAIIPLLILIAIVVVVILLIRRAIRRSKEKNPGQKERKRRFSRKQKAEEARKEMEKLEEENDLKE